MTRAKGYRHLAQKVRDQATREQSPLLKAEWEHLAECYVQLAKQTEESDQFDPICSLIIGTKFNRTIQ
jgi:gentisate 1,2-dioxygenase